MTNSSQMPDTKKHKRGERGSTEKSPNTSKKPNMADENFEETCKGTTVTLDADEDEPSLLEIKKILIGIQATIFSISQENKALKKEIEELKASANFNERELKDLKDSIQKAKDENKALKDSLASTDKQLKNARQELVKQNEESERLSEELDNLEQYTRKNSLEFHGIPQDAYSNTEEVVIKVANALNISVKPKDIEISHKLNYGKVIIAKFCSHKVKSAIYRERTKLKQVKVSDLFPSYPSSGQQRIFINENLTAFRRRVVEEANKRRREGTLISVWTLDGKIFVKTSPSGSPTRIFCKEDLDNM